MFEKLLARFPHFGLAGESRRVPSTLINGIESMPVTFRAGTIDPALGRTRNQGSFLADFVFS